MTQRRWLPIAAALTLLAAGSLRAAEEPQRVGVPPQPEMDLSDAGSSTIWGYCFDEPLVAPMRPTRFENVIADGDARVVIGGVGSVGLREAVTSGALAISAHQLNVTFQNRTSRPMRLQLGKGVVLWDRPGATINPGALAALGGAASSYDARQRRIWNLTNAERGLRQLGYYDNVPDNPEGHRTATLRFQKEHGLATSGELDEATLAKVQYAGSLRLQAFEDLGFSRSRRGRDMTRELARAADRYREFAGIEQGAMNQNDLIEAVAADRDRLSQALHPALRQGASGLPLRITAGVDDILAFEAGGRKGDYLISTPRGIELWSRRDSALRYVARGEAALRSFDDAQATIASRASRRGTTVLHTLLPQNGRVEMQIGKERVSFDRRELDRFLAGGEAPAELAKRVADLEGNLLVHRNAIAQGRGGDAGGAGEALASYRSSLVDDELLAAEIGARWGDRLDVYLANDIVSGIERLGSDEALAVGAELSLSDGSSLRSIPTTDLLAGSLGSSSSPYMMIANRRNASPLITWFTPSARVSPERFGRELAEAGRFGNAVVVQTVTTPASSALASEMIATSNARGVLRPVGNVDPDLARSASMIFARELQEKGGRIADLAGLWRASVDELVVGPGGETGADLRIAALRRVVVQIS